MKTLSWVIFCLLLPVSYAQAATTVVLERGPHHKVVGKISEYEVNGQTYSVTNSYTELASGMHYFEDNQWKETKEEIEIINGHAVASKGPHQVIFAANLNTAGSIDLQSRDGNRFQTHLLGISYTDAATGQSVLIGEVVDSVGAVSPPNQVIYQNAFDGDIIADVRYTYRREGFEQDVILLAAPPPPEAWNLNSATTRLEVWTEVLDAPEVTIRENVLIAEEDPVLRQQMFEPDLIDEELDFGDMEIPGGYAFLINSEDPLENEQIPTGKSYEMVDGRLVIIEKVDYLSILPYLQTLPQLARKANQPRKIEEGQRLFATRVLPNPPNGEPRQWKQTQVAKLDLKRPGFVLDYITHNSSITNYTFEGDETYFITGTVYCYGTTIIEGGTVVKYQTNNARLSFRGPVECRTEPGHPAIFTARDDDTVGQTLAESLGSVSAPKYGLVGLHFYATSQEYDIRNIQVRHIYRSVAMNANNDLTLSHAQLSHGNVASFGLPGSTLIHKNVLFYDFTNYVFFSTHENIGEHATIHIADKLAYNSTYKAKLTNSLIVAVTNNLHYLGVEIEEISDDTGIFQTVGGGGHYLAESSVYRDAGVANITDPLAADLGKRTTHPPIILTNSIGIDTILDITAPRDTEHPDLGFHYFPIDYAAQEVTVTDATIVLTNGAVVAVYGKNGFVLEEDSALISEGTPLSHNYFLRYYAAQELQTNWGGATASAVTNIFAKHDGVSPPDLRFRFTSSHVPSHGGYHLYTSSGSDIGFDEFEITHSALRGGKLVASDTTNSVYGITNSLLERVYIYFEGGSKLYFYNNLIRYAPDYVLLRSVGTNIWVFRDNLVDSSNLKNWTSSLDHEYNAYYQSSAFYSSYTTNLSEIVLTNLSYELGALGRYYLPTNSALTNNGSRLASAAGLYHFTTDTNQVKETNSTVDIGLHYVTLNTSTGLPLDDDSDGLADYFEDLDGDGNADASEMSWKLSDTDGDGVSDYVEWLQGRNPLDSSVTNNPGLLNLLIYTPLK